MSIGKRRYMKKQSKSPQIRFQNFEDEWLDSTIGRHISLLNGRAYKQEELLDEGKYKVLRVGNFNTNSKWYYSNLELEENKYVNKGDLLYLWATNFGPEIWTEEKAIYHYHIWKLEFDRTEINQDYLNIWLESDKNKIQQNTNGSTMVHITKTMMEERRISLPNFDEQSAIGSLFRTLDDLLASYKDNLTNYQSLKATMLSKMFPKAGQSVPEIRLDGFEGEWKVKELGDVVAFYSGLTYKPSDVVSSGTLVLRSSNVSDGELMYKDNVFVNPDIVNCQYVKLGDIVVVVRNGSRDLIGKHALIKSEMPNTVIGAFMTGVKSERPEFVNALLDTKVFISEINKNLGSTINQITTGNFKRMKFSFPTKEEQQVIGAYFSNLDNLINSYQEKISQLETLKKKLLQDMFI